MTEPLTFTQRVRLGGPQPGPRRRIISARIPEIEAVALRSVAQECGLDLSAYLRALLASHLEDLGRRPAAP